MIRQYSMRAGGPAVTGGGLVHHIAHLIQLKIRKESRAIVTDCVVHAHR
jgi:hypothetical protein